MEQETLNEIALIPGTQELSARAVEMIATVTQQKRDLDRAEKMIKEKLMGVMGANGVTKFECDRLAVTVVMPATKPREEFDLEGLKKDFPEIAEAYTHMAEGEAKAPYIKITVR